MNRKEKIMAALNNKKAELKAKIEKGINYMTSAENDNVFVNVFYNVETDEFYGCVINSKPIISEYTMPRACINIKDVITEKTIDDAINKIIEEQEEIEYQIFTSDPCADEILLIHIIA